MKSYVNPENRESEFSDIIFVSCFTCLRYPHVHDPSRAIWRRRYVDMGRYSEILDFLSSRHNFEPTVFKKKLFSLKTFRIQTVARIEDEK
jgi:hypothetical protein